MQVLDDEHQGMTARFAQQDPDDGLEGARAPELRVHTGKALFIVFDFEERIEIWKAGLQDRVELSDSRRDLLAPGLRILAARDAEIAM